VSVNACYGPVATTIYRSVYVCVSVGRSVYLSVRKVYCGKMAEWIYVVVVVLK